MHLGAINSNFIRLFPALLLCGATLICYWTGASAEDDGIVINAGPVLNDSQPITIVKSPTGNTIEPQATTLAAAPEPTREPAGADTLAPQVLTLDEALRLVLGNSPLLHAFDLEYSALDAMAWQAGRRPNPELELELDEFGGQADATGVRALSTALTYSQLLERGDKREKRVSAASLERDLVKWDRLEYEHELLGALREAYMEALIAQYELMRIEEYHELARRIHDVVAARVEAGRAAQLELAKLNIEMGAINLERDQARRAVNQAYLALAATWGAESITFETVAGDLLDLPALGGPTALELALADHPALARWDDEYQALCAALDLEFAGGVPDVSVSGGIKRLNESEETVFNVGVAIDLPVHDRNEGAISAAATRLEQVELRREAVRLALATELAGLYSAAHAALETYHSYEQSLLPAAAEHYELTNLGYTYGKFDLLEVLDAERTMIDLRNEQARALAEYCRARAGIEALVGTAIEDIKFTSNETVEDHNA